MARRVIYPKLGTLLSRAVGSKSQRWVAELCGVSQPAISAWLSGYSRPGRSHLVFLASLFKLDLLEVTAAAGYEIDDVMRLYTSRSISIYDLDYQKKGVAGIYQARVEGSPQLAIKLASALLSWLTAKELEVSGSTFHKDILKIKSQVLSEQAAAYREILPPDKVLAVIEPIAAELERIGKNIGEDEPFALASLCLADSYYIVKNNREALRHANDGLTMTSDANNKLLLYRTLLVNLALLKDKDAFEKESNKAISLLDAGEFSQLESACTLREGIGRGQRVLGLGSVLEMLEKGRNIYDQIRSTGERAPFRFIQLMRTEAEAVQMFYPKDRDLLLIAANNGLVFAKEYGYPRYIAQFEDLLNKPL